MRLGEPSKKKNCKSLDICPKQPYPTYLYPLVWTKFSLDINFSAYPTYLSNQFGHFGIRVCSWRMCQKHPDRGVPSFLWGYRAFSVSLGGVFTIYKSLRGVRDHFKNFQGRFWNFAYFYKYGHQYLTYLPQFFLSKLFRCVSSSITLNFTDLLTDLQTLSSVQTFTILYGLQGFRDLGI